MSEESLVGQSGKDQLLCKVDIVSEAKSMTSCYEGVRLVDEPGTSQHLPSCTRHIISWE